MSVILLRFHGMQNYYLITSTRGFTKKPVSEDARERSRRENHTMYKMGGSGSANNKRAK